MVVFNGIAGYANGTDDVTCSIFDGDAPEKGNQSAIRVLNVIQRSSGCDSLPISPVGMFEIARGTCLLP